MGVTLIFKNNSHPRRAVVRQPRTAGHPGGIVESVVCDPGMSFQEAERGLLDAAAERGIRATDETIKIASDRKRGPGKPLVSYPGRPAREK